LSRVCQSRSSEGAAETAWAISRKNLPSGAPATDEQVHHTIIAGLRTMPAFNQLVTDTDADDIVRYLHRLN